MFAPSVEFKHDEVAIGEHFSTATQFRSFFGNDIVYGRTTGLPCFQPLLEKAKRWISQHTGSITTLHFHSYLNDKDGSNRLSIHQDRSTETKALFQKMQSVVRDSVFLDYDFGIKSGKLVLNEIVGDPAQVSIHKFKMKVKSIMDEDPSSDVSHLFPLKVETPNDRSVEVKKMEAEVKRLWKEVGDLIEEYVLISVELLTKCQDPEAYNKATIEKDSHEEFLMESVSEALVACIRMGQYAGYQNGQQKAKNSQGLADNKWIYSFVQEGSDKWMQVLSPKKRDCPAMCSISKRQKMD